MKSMEWGHTASVVPLAHSQFWDSYAKAWDSVMRGNKTPEEALRYAEETVQKALDEQIEYNQFYPEYLKEHKNR